MYFILDVIILISLGILDQCISKTLKSIIKVIEKMGNVILKHLSVLKIHAMKESASLSLKTIYAESHSVLHFILGMSLNYIFWGSLFFGVGVVFFSQMNNYYHCYCLS